MSVRAGIGYDSHRLVAGRRLVLGGVELASEVGLEGHSDADVLTHAVIDALLGAAGLGDIGMHFPDSDERYRDADSIELLGATVAIVRAAGYTIVTATHDLNILPEIADRLIVFDEQHRIAAQGALPDILPDLQLLTRVNLIDPGAHRHGRVLHSHEHTPSAHSHEAET